jgi:hypothetical protein
MMKTRNAKQKPRTHFEQVPLAVVKKLIGAEPVNPAKTGAKNLIVEAATSKTEPFSLPAHSIAHADIKPKAAGRKR